MFGDDFRHNIAITRLKFEIYDMIARTGIVIGDPRERIMTTMNSDEKEERNKILLRLKREFDELDEKISSTEKAYLINKIRNSKLTHGISRLKEYDPDFLNGTSQKKNELKVISLYSDLYEFTEEEKSEKISDLLIKIFDTLPSLERIRDEDLFTPCVKYFQEQALQELRDIRNWENGNLCYPFKNKEKLRRCKFN
jgi:hypothetical protein